MAYESQYRLRNKIIIAQSYFVLISCPGLTLFYTVFSLDRGRSGYEINFVPPDQICTVREKKENTKLFRSFPPPYLVDTCFIYSTDFARLFLPYKVQHKLIIVDLNEIVHCISKPFFLITILHFNFYVHVFMENNKLN